MAFWRRGDIPAGPGSVASVQPRLAVEPGLLNAVFVPAIASASGLLSSRLGWGGAIWLSPVLILQSSGPWPPRGAPRLAATVSQPSLQGASPGSHIRNTICNL